MLRLAEWADVVIESFSPGTLDALGLGYEALSAVNPAIVVTSISNYGQSGPYRDWKGSELTIWGMGGPMLYTGSPNREPLKTAGHTPAYQVGATAAAATNIALWGADATGEGDHLDVNFFETFMGLIDRRTTSLLNYQYTGKISGRPPAGQTPGSGIWPTGDGGFFFTTVIGPRWNAMAAMIGHEDLLEDPNWLDPAWRSQEEPMAEFQALVGEWMLSHSKREIRQAFEDAGVYGGPVNTIAELLTDPHFTERAFFQTVDHPTTGPQTYPGRTYRSSAHEWPPPPRQRAPLLGEHTDEILGETLGLGRRRDRRAAERGGGLVTAGNGTGKRLPLEGIRILDFTVVWAGPYATQLVGGVGRRGDPRRVDEVLPLDDSRRARAAERGARARGRPGRLPGLRAGRAPVEPRRAVQRPRAQQALGHHRPHAPRGPGGLRAACAGVGRPDREQRADHHGARGRVLGAALEGQPQSSSSCACRRSG